ncbi:MAG TPA: Ig-like domain-containing protein [Vicinamibacterales bacterium]|jgi:hypothetical protein|nr:Ig-like domain-containing protein [Vicinamibacterales bacterium]
MVRSLSSFVVVVGLAVCAVGCNNNSTSPSATISSLTVTGSAPTVGGASQFKVTATMSDGTTQDVTSSATWVSSNTADAAVSGTGVVSGLADGAATITATDQGITGSESIVITG